MASVSSDREGQFAKLRQLGQHRDGKRTEMEDIFQRKRQALARQTALMEQLQHLQKEVMQCNLQLEGVSSEIHQADQEMLLVNDTLFDLDDQITSLEETLGVQDAEEETSQSSAPLPALRDVPVPHIPDARSHHQDSHTIQTTLTQTFGIASFRENQLSIIQATMAPHHQDVFVIMRTGGGKSLLYQLPVVLERTQLKVTLVISPLLSLMQGTVYSTQYTAKLSSRRRSFTFQIGRAHV